ncbi:hypothetical protein ACC685_33530 [Rhizobium ruizarguesonis]
MILLRKIHENWHKIEKIGTDAEERGRKLGLTPSWATASDDEDGKHIAAPVTAAARLRNKLGAR